MQTAEANAVLSNGTANAVTKTLTVECESEKAFAIFTDRMGAWWPATHHVGALAFRDIVVEHQTGGHWFEINEKDERVQWGVVLAWEPPARIVLSWHLGPNWNYDASLDRASEVEVTFTPEGARSTRIQLTHRHLERHGENHEKLRNDVDSPGGWSKVLADYQQFANS